MAAETKLSLVVTEGLNLFRILVGSSNEKSNTTFDCDCTASLLGLISQLISNTVTNTIVELIAH